MADATGWRKRKEAPPKRGATPVVEKQRRRIHWPKLPHIVMPWRTIAAITVVTCVGVFINISYRYWPITDVVVDGRLSVHSPQDIARQLLWLKQESFFSADLSRVQREVSALPLMSAVAVSKQWPASVLVRVQEAVPVARWNDNELLDSAGLISTRPDAYQADSLPQIRAHARYADLAARSYRLIQQVLLERQVTIQQLLVSSSGSISAELSNGWRVALGQSYIEQRLTRLAQLLDHLPAPQVARLDLRYGKGAAIAWRQEERES
ncbi:hypothetical protein CHH28_00290 [Bacterioplanes sanyensis]|uniref:POTRA domain-containing protein n=1 Tax=Bacterioplanes sanyensis TaxID=1249553 RepID=A0A222FDQ4_9GAMM|nr:FtsQ-type POTRA domain-containing protein [Bacterioplanes sanyensis]ASP37217.1 hypothetical protein CHH28_00290 [Bacterioplanes sanyensis]